MGRGRGREVGMLQRDIQQQPRVKALQTRTHGKHTHTSLRQRRRGGDDSGEGVTRDVHVEH